MSSGKNYSEFNDADKVENDSDQNYVQPAAKQDKSLLETIKGKIVDSSNQITQKIINLKSQKKPALGIPSQKVLMDNNTYNLLMKQKDNYQKQINELKATLGNILDESAIEGIKKSKQSINKWLQLQIKLRLLEQKNLYWCSLQEELIDDQAPLWVADIVGKVVEGIFEDIQVKKS